MSTQQLFNSFKKLPISILIVVYLVLLFATGLLMQGCTDTCETSHTYTYYEPVYTTLDELRSMVVVSEPATMQSTGKIYFKDNYLFVNEINKGVHVIDNNDPSDPKHVSFINVPGTTDLSAKGDFLYVDSYIDLVVLNISDLNNIHEVYRVENIFDNYNYYGYYVDPELGLVTDWQEVEKLEVFEGDCNGYNNYYPNNVFRMSGGIAAMEDLALTSSSPISGGGPGVGGSMATFTIYDNYLYTISDSELTVIDISNLNAPMIHAKQFVGWGIETLFPYQDKLFIGSNSGMYIYDNVDPKNPSQISVYEHITSCDPVVVQGDYAYVTLRSGTNCQGFTNQLEVVNISDLSQPYLEATYPMFNPHGLGIDNNNLFICDGEAGLKIYDASDIYDIDNNLKAQYGNIHALDVIPLNNVLMMIGDDGLYQYDYEDIDDIKLLSTLPITSVN